VLESQRAMQYLFQVRADALLSHAMLQCVQGVEEAGERPFEHGEKQSKTVIKVNIKSAIRAPHFSRNLARGGTGQAFGPKNPLRRFQDLFPLLHRRHSTYIIEIRNKLSILADAAKYDASCASSGSRRARASGGIGNTEGMGICHSYTPDGRCVSLLKLLLTNYCIYDCSYCVNRISSDTPRARFTPDEVAFLTIEFYKRNYIEGLFLSSGIIQNADYTMEQMIRAARLLREQHLFNGYIHLKAVPRGFGGTDAGGG